MDFKVVLSDLFLADLQEIIEHLTEHAGPQVASRIGNDLLDRIEQVARHPFSGRRVTDRPGARKILRYPYLMFFDVNESAHSIEVLRVFHGARNLGSLPLDC